MALTKIDDRGLKTPIDLLDNEKIRFGTTDNDLEIFHSGSSYISNTTATDLVIRNVGNAGILIQNQNSFPIELKTNAESAIKCNANGSVELYFDGVKQIHTTSTGVTLGDDKRIDFGDGADLKIYHDQTDSRITNSTGYLYIDSPNIAIRSDGGSEDSIQALQNGAVRLYHDGTLKFLTGTDGSYGSVECKAGKNGWDGYSIGGYYVFMSNNQGAGNTCGIYNDLDNEWLFSGERNAAASLYYDGQAKLQTSGNGVRIPDDIYLGLGNNDDLNIRFLNGTGAFIQSGGENMYIRSNLIELGDNSGHKYIKCIDAGAVELYHGVDSKKFETTSTGVTVTTDLVATGNVNPSSDGGGNLGQPAKRWYRGYFTHGIGLNGETSAGNMLDDYEEGTWTPALTGITSQSYIHQLGSYTKIGNKVHLDFYITVDSANANGTHYEISGLPFNLKNANNIRGGGCSTYWSLHVDSSHGTNDQVVAFYGSAGSNSFALYQGHLAPRGTSGTANNSQYLIGFFEYIAA